MGHDRGRVYNKIYSRQEYELVNPFNKHLLEDFLEEYKQRKIKPSTILQYENDLRIILVHIKNNFENRSILELTKKDFRKISLWLTEDLKLSNARVNRMLSVIRSLLSYAEDDDEYDYDNNVARKVKGLPKEPVKTNEDDFYLSFDQVMRLREELIRRGKLQQAVLLMLMFDSGGRRYEIYQVKKTGLLNGNKTNVVIGKRGKVFSLIYLNDTKELIRQYLEQRGDDDIESLWINVDANGNKKTVTSQTIYEWVVQMSNILSELEGKTIKFFPHSLRHSRIECLLQGTDTRIIDPATGKPRKFTLQECQLFAHHEDPKTTQGYTKNHADEIIDNMFNFS